MSNGRRIGTLLIAGAVGLVLGFGAVPARAKPTPVQKCDKAVRKASSSFVSKRLAKVQKCANKASKTGASAVAGCLTQTRNFKSLTKSCTTQAIGELFSDKCVSSSPACSGIAVGNASQLQQCLQCSLTHATNCVVAVTYNVQSAQTAGCFPTP